MRRRSASFEERNRLTTLRQQQISSELGQRMAYRGHTTFTVRWSARIVCCILGGDSSIKRHNIAALFAQRLTFKRMMILVQLVIRWLHCSLFWWCFHNNHHRRSALLAADNHKPRMQHVRLKRMAGSSDCIAAALLAAIGSHLSCYCYTSIVMFSGGCGGRLQSNELYYNDFVLMKFRTFAHIEVYK